jgi:hypothetical protein
MALRRFVRFGEGLLNRRIFSQAGHFHQRLSDDLFRRAGSKKTTPKVGWLSNFWGAVQDIRFRTAFLFLDILAKTMRLLRFQSRTQSTKYSSRPLICSVTRPWISVWKPGKRLLKSRANCK